MAILVALFPPDHPFHWSTIGEIADLHAATIDEAHAFFRAYYHPGNASLAVAGDVNTDAALALVEAYFGGIARGPEVPPVEATASLDEEKRLVMEDRVELPRLYLSWHSSSMFTDQDAQLDLLSDLLANGKTSRLYQRLVYERQMATDVAAVQNSREMSGFFQVMATPTPGRGLAELELEISAEIDRLMQEGPLESEVERSRAQVKANFIYRLQTVGGFGGKSDQLNAYNVFLDDPGYFDRDLAQYLKIGREELRQVAARYLDRGRRVTLSVVPQGRLDLAVPASEPVTVS
jgi:zinc protease